MVGGIIAVKLQYQIDIKKQLTIIKLAAKEPINNYIN